MTRNVRVTRRLLRVKDVLAPPRMSYNTGAGREGWSAAMTLLMECSCVWSSRVTGSQRSSERSGRSDIGPACRQGIYPTPERNTSLWQRSPSHPSCLNGPLTLFSLWFPLFTTSFTSVFDAVSAQRPHQDTWNILRSSHAFLLGLVELDLWKGKKQSVNILYIDRRYIMSTSFLLFRA